MRYYNFALYATSDEIKEKTTINLREYGYDNTLIAVNNYKTPFEARYEQK